VPLLEPVVSSRLKSQSLVGGRRGGHVVEIQRGRLLIAFSRVLAENGLQGASVGRVCGRARVSRRTFYDLFDDREACFLAVIDDAMQRVSGVVLPAYGQDGGWSERIRNALMALLGFLDEQPALARVLLIETLKTTGTVSERRRRVLDALTSAVDEGRNASRADPPPLTAQSTVGGAISVIHARVLESNPNALIELLNPLMGMIVLPYFGPAAARRELTRPVASPEPAHDAHAPASSDPFKDLPIRITFRTARVLSTIATHPGASNRQIGEWAGVTDQGQISKLLTRLQRCELIENHGQGHSKGEPNAWQLTKHGHAILQAIGTDGTADSTPVVNV
jgi:AcrR family transcriptional regulator